MPTQEKKISRDDQRPPNRQQNKTKLNDPYASNRQRPAPSARPEINASTHSTPKTRKPAPLKAKPPTKPTPPAPEAKARGKKRCHKTYFTQKIHHDPRPAPPPNTPRQAEASPERDRMKATPQGKPKPAQNAIE